MGVSCYRRHVLRIYRRHLATCRFTSERYRRCQCPIYVEGTLGPHSVRKSLNQTSWEAASETVAAWTAAGEIGKVKVEIPPIAVAISKFLEDAKARHLGWQTIKKYRHLLEKRLLARAATRGISALKQIDVDQLRLFRGTWEDGALYASKNIERLRAFFRFCHQAGWIPTNPALAVKPPKVHGRPTLPFSEEEMKRVLVACDRFRGKKARMKAFVLVMRYSGLRIGDTVTLRCDRLKGSKLLLYTAKTGTPVYIPLPAAVVDALTGLETAHAWYFWTGKGKVVTAVSHWQRSLQSLFALAHVDGAHSHRFRDSFAVSLLEKGVSIETVAMLLGHSDIRVTLRHYRPWVKSLQTHLENEVQKAWATDQNATAQGNT
jgi:site-specific recombinase XerD